MPKSQVNMELPLEQILLADMCVPKHQLEASTLVQWVITFSLRFLFLKGRCNFLIYSSCFIAKP